MKPTVAIGKQNFASLIENDYFYIDNPFFIKEWWENKGGEGNHVLGFKLYWGDKNEKDNIHWKTEFCIVNRK